jgi:transposase-like protein
MHGDPADFCQRRSFWGRKFQSETIELCVRWYITYRLSYRDVAAMMVERGIVVSHTTIMRWVLSYVPVASVLPSLTSSRSAPTPSGN